MAELAKADPQTTGFILDALSRIDGLSSAVELDNEGFRAIPVEIGSATAWYVDLVLERRHVVFSREGETWTLLTIV